MKKILYFTKKIHLFAGKKLYFNLFGMIFISLFEGVGIFLLIPLISVSGLLNLNLKEDSSLNLFNNLFNGLPNNLGLPVVLVIYTLLLILHSAFQRNQTRLNGEIQQGFIRHLREETYRGVLIAKWELFLRLRKTDIINSLTTEINRVGAGIQMFLQFITSLAFTMIQIGIALFLSVKLTLIVLMFGGILLVFSKKFLQKNNIIGNQTVELSKAYLANVSDQLNGIKDIKSNTLELSHINRVSSLSKDIENNTLEAIRLRTNTQFIFKAFSAILIAVFAYVSIVMFRADSANLMIILLIFSRLWPRVTSIQFSLEQLNALLPSFENIIKLQKESADVAELGEYLYSEQKKIGIRREIKCTNVSFRYDRSMPVFALRNINLSIKANKTTAIVGPSGAGKSTLVDIIMGLNQPEVGMVSIDGSKLTRQLLFSLRKSVGYVPQDPFLFNGTIRENLIMMESSANEEELWEALEFSSAADFVRELPQGLDTLIGDRGLRLSGGERQRIVLARAILRKPTILVLDEATSSLDSENEWKIQRSLEKLRGQMTIIIIAHRLSTIKNADQVIVLDQGEIIQFGEYNQLAADRKGMFSHLLGKQLEATL